MILSFLHSPYLFFLTITLLIAQHLFRCFCRRISPLLKFHFFGWVIYYVASQWFHSFFCAYSQNHPLNQHLVCDTLSNNWHCALIFTLTVDVMSYLLTETPIFFNNMVHSIFDFPVQLFHATIVYEQFTSDGSMNVSPLFYISFLRHVTNILFLHSCQFLYLYFGYDIHDKLKFSIHFFAYHLQSAPFKSILYITIYCYAHFPSFYS